MFSLKNQTIRVRLILLFFLISIVPLVLGGVVSYFNFQNVIKKEVNAKMELSTQSKASELTKFMESLKTNAELLADSADVKQSTSNLIRYHNEMGFDATTPFDITGVKVTTKVSDEGDEAGAVKEVSNLTMSYTEIWDDASVFLQNYIEKNEYDDVYLICAKHGHVMYSFDKAADIGENLVTGRLKDGILAKVWAEAKKGEIYSSDIVLYDVTNTYDIFVAAPVMNAANEMISILVMRVPQSHINTVMQANVGMGETGQSYLVGSDYMPRTNPRLSSEDMILKRRIENIGTRTVFEKKTDFEGVYGNYDSEANAKMSNRDFSTSLNGISVLGMNTFMPEYNWALVTEVDTSEAYAGLYSMRTILIILIFLVVLLAIIILYFFSNSINKTLKNSITQIISSANSLAASAQQTSAASQQTSSISQQLASGALEQSKQSGDISKSVTIMASAVQQMSASAQEASGAAQKSSELAQEAGRTSEKSQSSLKDIKNIVSNTASMTKEMSNKSKKIGDIVEAITSIAKQTNLLALNANIEAARAGEAGRGFAVVADEVRKLSESSSDAAEQIKSLVGDMISGIEETASAAEAGTKTVEESTEIINGTIQSLQSISSAVMQISAKIQELSSSIEQQAAGTQQIAKNMDSIVAIAEQNSSGAQQLSATTQQQSSANQQVAAAAQQLQALSGELMILVQKASEKSGYEKSHESNEPEEDEDENESHERKERTKKKKSSAEHESKE